MTEQGPTFFFGLFLLVVAVVPVLLLHSQPWKAIAIANAGAHFVTGFAWTMAGTRYTRTVRNLALIVWNLTILVSIGLLVAAFFVD